MLSKPIVSFTNRFASWLTHRPKPRQEATASAYGNSGSGIDYENSDPADVAALVNVLMKDSQHRPNRKLLEMWARMSGEAVKWVVDRAAEGGAQVIDQGNEQHKPLLAKTGYNLSFVTSYFGPKPYTTAEGMAALCTVAEKAGVEIFYSTPAEQLVQDDAGKVTGVIAKSGDSHIQFNASKGVVMATGDYQNDTEMLYYYLPDMVSSSTVVVWSGPGQRSRRCRPGALPSGQPGSQRRPQPPGPPRPDR